MVVTRKASSQQRGEPSHCRNPDGNPGVAVARAQRRERPNYAEYSSDADDFSDAQSISASESSPTAETVSATTRPSRIANAPEACIRSDASTSKCAAHEAESSSQETRRPSAKVERQLGRKRRSTPLSQSNKRHKLKTSEAPSLNEHNENAFIPNWRDPRMPFECWVDVFLYAAREGSTEALSNSWLIQAAMACKAFTEPALTAIYRCPAIKSAAKAKRLALLLERPISVTLFNYRAKIDTLHINIHLIPHGVLFPLIHPLTRLKELIIYTPLDQPPYRELDKTKRWHYPEEVFKALEARSAESTLESKPFPTTLKSWEWSGRFLGGFVANFDAMTPIHQSTPFSQLTRLSLTNCQVPSLKNLRIVSEEKELQTYHEDGAVIHSIANAISQLHSLKHLVFESSTVMNDRLLPLLPKTLVHFELINCWEVKSNDLAAFLRTHGSDMRTLSLMHNQSLDLAFLTDLNEACPKLRELNMNLSYYRHHDCINDADPMYDQALLASQIPKWPASLRVINIEHIRDWSVEAAEMFLQSIIDSAPGLPELRYLAIKTMLDIPWQARATMRRAWRDKMEKVFLRPYVPPTSSSTLRPSSNGKESTFWKKQSLKSANLPSRRSGRIASTSEPSESHTLPAKSSRLQRRSQPSYKEPDTDEEEFITEEDEQRKMEDESSEQHSTSAREQSPTSNETSPIFVHGKCTTVNILFDNQKVRELQYSMEDFGSGESDSEEEWDGDYEDEGSFVVF